MSEKESDSQPRAAEARPGEAAGPESHSPSASPREGGASLAPRLWRAGRTCWALLGIFAVVAVALYLVGQVPLVVVPVVLALFPATLLAPVAGWMKRKGVPPALAAIATILAGILLLAALIGGMVPLVIRGLPELAESASEGIGELEGFLGHQPLGLEIEGFSDLLEAAREWIPEAGVLAAGGLAAAVVAFETITGIALMVVLLFFYLKDGHRLSEGMISLLPRGYRPQAREVAQGSWETLGSYFRGQLLVALVDAVLIGLGLLILGVPLAIPLAVLVFFGGLFPIVGAVVTGALAVLVALAHGGLGLGLIVLGIVLAVQQLEGNVLEPLILGRVIHLHPVVILLSITTGALLLGILGAFLAVPVAAIIARSVSYLTGEDGAQGDRGDAHQEA